MNKIETLVNEEGKEVVVFPMFTRLYQDEECISLTKEYVIETLMGEQELSTLGKAEAEIFAAKILALSMFTGLYDRGLVGVAREELKNILAISGTSSYMNNFLDNGLFREDVVGGVKVVFPTRKLLENQRVPKREPLA